MNIGKLGEGVYLLTIGPSGRTIKPAKMAKAVKKTREQESKTSAPAQTLQEELASMQAEALKMPPKDWWTASELAIEFGVPVAKIYQSNQWLAPYISKPDGKHYLYHRDVFQDKQVVDIVKGVPFLPAASKVSPAPTREAKAQKPKTQVAEVVDTKREEKPVEAKPEIAEAVAASEAANVSEPAETYAAAAPIVVNRKVYCKELDRTFDSVTDGAKAIGVRREILSKSLRAGHKCHGYTFEYVDEENSLPMWLTADAIAKQLGISRSSVVRHTRELPETMVSPHGNASYRFHRDVLSLPIWEDVKNGANRLFAPKVVRCKETGEIFASQGDAAHAFNTTAGAISAAIRRKHRCNGFTFEAV